MLHSIEHTIYAGAPLKEADKVLIMLHGRGAYAEDIVSLAEHLHVSNTHIIAPQAKGSTWYPYSFMWPVQQNEPWLSSAIELLNEILKNVLQSGKKSQQVYVLGFSQGACLTLEFAARNAMQFGGIISFTGGLIGEKLNESQYKGNFNGTKIFIGNSDHDPHVPLTRSESSKKILENLGANVMMKVYPDMPHTINQDELKTVNELFFNHDTIVQS